MFCVLCQIQVPVKKHTVPDLSKLGALLHKTHQGPSGTKVPRLDMCRSILSFGVNRTTERVVGVGVKGNRQGRGKDWPKFEKRVVGNIGGSS